ncbi:MAG: tRNA (guanosine(37)-N1)-methyltransferase TrmD [bacterium]
MGYRKDDTPRLDTPRMFIEIVTLFPEGIESILGESMLKRAHEFGIVQTDLVQLRDFAEDKHGTVDDKLFGGGAGMVLKPEPIAAALRHLREKRPEPKPLVILTSPQGRTLTQELVEELAARPRLTILCGHYKGVDQRAIDEFVDLEVSIGDYILTGGELAAAVVVDAVVRLLPGVLGDPDSAAGDSFTRGLLDLPHYTQPAVWEGHKVPEILLSGHHAKLEKWRQQQALERTRTIRPDLYRRWIERYGDPESEKGTKKKKKHGG